MGPYEADCPEPILDLLTPTTSADAIAWRTRCRANAVARREKLKLRSGSVVIFDEPLTFTDGSSHDRLEVVIDPRRPRVVRFRPPGGSGLYRIGGLDRRGYRIDAIGAG